MELSDIGTQLATLIEQGKNTTTVINEIKDDIKLLKARGHEMAQMVQTHEFKLGSRVCDVHNKLLEVLQADVDKLKNDKWFVLGASAGVSTICAFGIYMFDLLRGK